MTTDSEGSAVMRCGYIALVGRPNVGKSTLLNHILGQKVSITSKKAQTTRHQILGVKTLGNEQAIFVDTPGIHREETRELNRVLNKTSQTVLQDADVILFVVEALKWTPEDEHVLQLISGVRARRCLVINKVDRVSTKNDLFPYIADISSKLDFDAVIPVSAEKGTQVDALEGEVYPMLPEGIHLFPEDQITDRSLRFLTAEIIREKIMRQLGEEIPYNIAVEIESFKTEGRLVRIHGLIWVERDGQKKIVIGRQGERLKRIGTDARKDIEALLESKVMLQLWVKVKSGWSNSERALRSLGYDEG